MATRGVSAKRKPPLPFRPGGPRIFTLPPHAPFLACTAAALIEALGARENPLALSSALVFMPNRRAAQGLAIALSEAMDGPVICPDIRALGDLDEGDDAGLTDAAAPPPDLPPELPPARRRGELVRRIADWRRNEGLSPLPPPALLAAADELARLIDGAAIADEVDWTRLAGAADESDLAEHWRRSSSFLNIVANAWPGVLAEQGALDGAARRLLAVQGLTDRWRKHPPKSAVLVAGSTGAQRATRLLMQAAAALPRGAVLLPGVDLDLDEGAWREASNAPSHPNYVLSRTLSRLGVARADLALWPAPEPTPGEDARTRLIREALAPASATRGWNQRLRSLAEPDEAGDFVRRALQGVRLVEAADASEQALAAALLLREALETPGRTAALVTPDPDLARRTSAALRRWNIDIDPSAGDPLHRTALGGLILLLMRLARDPADPVLLLAVLKHALVRRTEDDGSLGALETACMRGPRRFATLAALAAHVQDLGGEALLQAAHGVRTLAAAVEPLSRLLRADRVDGEGLVRALTAAVDALAASPPDAVWSGREAPAVAAWLEAVASFAAAAGSLGGVDLLDIAETLALEVSAPPERPEHPRLAIWGPLEARLQRRDLIILGGLNEGAWPGTPPADPFLNRRLRGKLGLLDPDERIGLAAHDFEQLFCAPEVVLLRAKRLDDQPRVASRWIWRLATLAAGGLRSEEAASRLLAHAPGRDPLAWAARLQATPPPASRSAPRPAPPFTARRLEEVSPTRIGELIRDPFSDYAKRLLRLQKLDPVGADVSPAGRGSAVHAAIEDFERAGGTDDLAERLIARLTGAGLPPAEIAFHRPLWERAAKVYVDWRAGRAPRVAEAALEQRAVLKLTLSFGEVVLRATADRVERLTDGTLAIIDFKSSPKSLKQVQTGLEPQLPLEAAIASRVGFGPIQPAPVSELIYVTVAHSKATVDDGNGEPLKLEPEAEAEKALANLCRLLEAFARPATPYLSKPRAQFAARWGDYDRLARRGEWTLDEGDGE